MAKPSTPIPTPQPPAQHRAGGHVQLQWDGTGGTGSIGGTGAGCPALCLEEGSFFFFFFSFILS